MNGNIIGFSTLDDMTMVSHRLEWEVVSQDKNTNTSIVSFKFYLTSNGGAPSYSSDISAVMPNNISGLEYLQTMNYTSGNAKRVLKANVFVRG